MVLIRVNSRVNKILDSFTRLESKKLFNNLMYKIFYIFLIMWPFFFVSVVSFFLNYMHFTQEILEKNSIDIIADIIDVTDKAI